MNWKNQLFIQSIMAVLLFVCINIFISGGVYASDQYTVAKGKYIIVLKESEFVRGLNVSRTGESVGQVADRLVNEVRQNQISVDAQKGVFRSARNADEVNKLGLTYEYAIKGFSAALTEESVQFLKNKPEVSYIEPDILISISAIQAPTPSWGLDRVDQQNLPLDQSYQYNTDGSNVHVYILDTGIRATHNEFGNRVGSGYDFIDNDSDANDCNGHGTHVAGTVGGASFGVAKNAMLYPVRVLNCAGSGWYSQIIAGIDWVSLNHQSPAVANMSLEGPVSQALDTALNNTVNAGVSFVVAAGNDNSDACNVSPARVTNAITVASSDSSDQRSGFSNTGTCVDIFAPGSFITSAWHTSNMATNTISGTSMAAPHVAGVAALFLETNFTASTAEVTNAIISNSTTNRISDVGAGTPNRLLFSQPPNTPPPSLPTPTPEHLGWLVPVINLILL
ncbi:MAG: S8 family peptidase [Gammaproteobacteria bacterium]|nr:S8 family peptidase [Gammaproteobacteria bacterium]